MFRKTITLAATIMALSLALSPSPSRAKEPLKVAMTTWVGYGLLHLAKQQGFFDRRGVPVELVTVQDKASTAAAIASGRLDGWATTVDTFIFYNASKIGVRQVLAVDFSAGGEGIVAASDIAEPRQLKGRTVAAEEGSSTYFFLLNVLKEAGLTIADIRLQNMRAGDAGAAFAAGRVDAAATWDPWLAQATKRPGGRVLVDTRQRPGLIVDTVAFRNDVLTQRRSDIVNFIRAYFDAYDSWKSDPEQANAIMAKALGIPQDEFKASLAGIEFTARDANQKYFGEDLQRVTETGIKSYRDAGILKDAVDAAALVDIEPLLQALAK